MNFFRFKQFQITDDRSAMKVGTDAVLLASWVKVENVCSVLDIGSGSGLISVMLAQRIADAQILGVELEPTNDAQFNFENSPWNNCLNIVQHDIRHFELDQKFDLVISNPPFFKESLLPEKQGRAKARHDYNLTLSDLLNSAISFLNEDGTFALVYPYDRQGELVEKARELGLYVQRILNTQNKPAAPIKRSFIEFKRKEVALISNDSLCIRDIDNAFSNEYRDLTKDFYLNF